MNFKRTTTHLALALGGLLLVTDAALAATATGTFPVTATVANTCTVSSTGVAFGSYTGVAVANTANNIVVTCNKGVTIASFFIGNGANPSGTQKPSASPTTSTCRPVLRCRPARLPARIRGMAQPARRVQP